MARRDLLTDTERRALFGVPTAREDLARHYMLSARDLALVAARRGDTNRIGFAVQLALLRHPGFGFTLEEGAPAHFVVFMGGQIGVAASAFGGYAARPATSSVHAREAEATLGLRQPTNADLPFLIDAGAQAAWSTDRGVPIVVGITEALRASCITLPAPSVIERVGIAGRARALQLDPEDRLGRVAHLHGVAQRASGVGMLDYLILVPTLRCNLSCSYCQVSRVAERSVGFDWDERTTAAVLDVIDALDTDRVKIEFQGGEPTLRPDLIRRWINSADDFINPRNLDYPARAVRKMKNARFRLIPETADTHGHGTHTWAVNWKADLADLLTRTAAPGE